LIARKGSDPPEWEDQGIYSSMPAHSSYRKNVQKFTVIK
jgi:hypothetical protein